MDINLKINSIPVLGNIKLQNTIYYVDANKEIYTLCNNKYTKVEDISIIKKILNYISPVSRDIK